VRPSSPGPHPVLFMVHGGPISDWSDRWHWRWSAAMLASRGYLVALPNPRGSLGYGMSFMDGIWGNRWGGQCYQDLMACVDVLSAREDTDGDRIGAMGGSFGGYMMNWFGVSTGRFRCLISHAGISNLSSFQGVTDHPAWWLHQQGVSAVADPVEQGRYSPMLQVRRWTSPVLFIHGEKDYRCPIDQALQLYTALQLQGVSSELLVFPDEGHWIQKPRNIVAWYSAVLAYLGDQLSVGHGGEGCLD
jgi:dipeptidyl aminopeptidase/acylaminoacyl peptidase